MDCNDLRKLIETTCSNNPFQALAALQKAKGYLDDAIGKMFGEDKIEAEAFNLFYSLATDIKTFIENQKHYCVICADKLALEQDFKFLTCEKTLCRFQAEELGLGDFSLREYASKRKMVLDFLICMTYAAAVSDRKKLLLDPFPETFIRAGKRKDYDAVTLTLTQVPAISDWPLSKNEDTLRTFLDARVANAYDLLLWIITSNRSHIESTEISAEFKGQKIRHQFSVAVAEPGKETRFREHLSDTSVTKNRSTLFAYHGAPMDAWHRIIRTGLSNCSDTAFKVNGAAYGKGVYLSPDFATSLSYTKNGPKWPNSTLSAEDNIRCISRVELIKYKGLAGPAPHYVIPKEGYLKVRDCLIPG